MGWTPLMAFAVIALIFAFGDLVANKTKGIISSIIFVIIVLLVFGSVLHILPTDIFDQSGLLSLIPTFGMGLILVNLGSMLNLNDLKREWKTVLVALAGILGIVILQFTIGGILFGREQAYVASAPTAGGMAATMMLTQAANESGRPDLASFAASVMALQILIGLPIASFCLRKEADRFITANGHKTALGSSDAKAINIRIIPTTPKSLDIPSMHLARLAITAVIASTVTQLTGISDGITFLVFGIIFGALGLIEPRALQQAGAESLLMLATYASVVTSFVGMTISQFGSMLIPVIGLLLLGAVGVIIFATIIGKLLKWTPWLSIAVGLCCMIGYPVTYAVAMEVANGAVKGKGFTTEEEQRVVDYILPKMIVSGTTSVSIASVILAGIVAPMIFG